MSTMPEVCNQGSVFEQFEYRLVYLRPTAYSDERIAVGLVAAARDHLEARFVSSVDSLELMSRIFGEAGVEQFQFAAAELRRALSRCASLDSLTVLTDLLVVGEKTAAFTQDRTGLLASILASASCLVRSEPSRNSDVVSSAPAVALTRDLFEQVSRLNPLVAHELFNKKIKIEGDTVDLPICGTKIFGAPVSYAARDLRMRAESYVAKFVWLRQHLSQQPRVYLLTPQEGTTDVPARLDSNIRELRAIAVASNVPLKTSDSTEELATLIIQEEAA
jgi:hypothetical protein